MASEVKLRLAHNSESTGRCRKPSIEFQELGSLCVTLVLFKPLPHCFSILIDTGPNLKSVYVDIKLAAISTSLKAT